MYVSKLFIILCIISLVSSGSALDVGVYVEFPQDSDKEGVIYTKCISIDKGSTGYDVLHSTGGFNTKDYGFGHAICNIQGIGCTSNNCFCDTKFWNFYINSEMSSTGVDDYMPVDGDIMQFVWSSWGAVKPTNVDFESICPEDDENSIWKPRSIMTNMTRNLLVNETYTFYVHRRAHSDYPEPKAIVEILPQNRLSDWKYRRVKDIGHIFKGFTDIGGAIDVSIPATGSYVAIVHKNGATNKLEIPLKVSDILASTTTTSSSTTSSTTIKLNHLGRFRSWWLPGWYNYN